MGISIGIGNYIGNTKVQGGITPKPRLIASYKTYNQTNDSVDRDKLVDLTGNGHDINLFNFSYTEGSGYKNGGLVFDGIDDYGICNNFPILKRDQGYTIIAIRKWLSIKTDFGRFLSNFSTGDGERAFTLESISTSGQLTASFGTSVSANSIPNVLEDSNLFVYQTTTNYNGVKDIQLGDYTIGSNVLSLGSLSGNTQGGYSNIIFYACEIYEGELSPQEIAEIKVRMMNEWYEKAFDPKSIEYQALWTCNGKSNYDTDKNIPNLVDSTNPLVLNNFAFSGNSGYNNYLLDFRRFDTVGARCELTRTFNLIHVTKILTESNPKFEEINPSANYPSYQIRVTGLKSGASIKPFAATLEQPLIIITQDGTYTVPEVNRDEVAWYGYIIEGYANNEECDINIELLPTGELGLYQDGVDDYVVSTKFLPDIGLEYTVVGDLDPSTINNIFAGITKHNNWYWYKGLLYINGNTISTPVPSDKWVWGFNSNGLIVLNDSIIEGAIGTSSSSNEVYTKANAKMGFNSLAIIPRVLTETQIRQVYEYLKTIKANNI